jgi:hypothetical protein
MSFSDRDVSYWANYSYDFNPIHFDREKITKYGLTELVAHGMLVMLRIKQQLADLSLKQDDNKWTQFKVMLKSPVLLYTFQKLELKLSYDGFKKFTLKDYSTGEKSYTGYCKTNYTFPIDTYNHEQRFVVSKDIVIEKYNEFCQEYSCIKHFFIWLDSLIFSEFVRLHLNDTFIGLADKHNNGDYFSLNNSFVMHTSHEILLCNAIANKHLAPNTIGEELNIEYCIRESNIINSSTSVYGSIIVPIWINNTLVMEVVVGLMRRENKNN